MAAQNDLVSFWSRMSAIMAMRPMRIRLNRTIPRSEAMVISDIN